MRTGQYRYTEWGNNGERGRELYNYYADPNETVNIVDLPENEELVSHLSEQLHAGWQAALPDMYEQTHVPETLPWDINKDGIVDIQDLILVSNSFDVEPSAHPKVDVNDDGRVDIIDLLLVAAHFGESSNPGAPTTHAEILPEHLNRVNEWLAKARLADDGSNVFKQGIATLEALLVNTCIIPEGNCYFCRTIRIPFNPETWIPYDLAEDADVRIHIYNLKGQFNPTVTQGRLSKQLGTYRTQISCCVLGWYEILQRRTHRKWQSIFTHFTGGGI